MARGRKPTPTHLKVLRGNPGCRPINDSEPKARDGEPPRPDAMTPVARQEWERVSMELAAMGLLKTCDMAVLSMYAQAWADWVSVNELYIQAGAKPVVDWGERQEGKGFRMNPFLSVRHRVESQLMRWAAELGLSPSVRSRLRMQDSAASAFSGSAEMMKDPRLALKEWVTRPA